METKCCSAALEVCVSPCVWAVVFLLTLPLLFYWADPMLCCPINPSYPLLCWEFSSHGCLARVQVTLYHADGKMNKQAWEPGQSDAECWMPAGERESERQNPSLWLQPNSSPLIWPEWLLPFPLITALLSLSLSLSYILYLISSCYIARPRSPTSLLVSLETIECSLTVSHCSPLAHVFSWKYW